MKDEVGVVKAEFDEKSKNILNNWEPSSPVIKRDGDNYVIIVESADFRNLPFPVAHKGSIRLAFTANKENPRMLYYLDVVQTDHGRG